LGVQRSNISHILSERNKPSLDFVLKIVNQFPEVSLDWLLKGQGEMFRLKAIKPESNNLQLDLEEESSSNEEESLINQDQEEIVVNLKNPETAERIVENVISDSEILRESGLTTESFKNLRTVEQVMLLYTDGSFRIFKPQE
jgi:phage repressor protein C with HTH and peptisase S24 domain